MSSTQTSAIINNFNDEQGFVDLMNECGIRQNGIDRIVDDGFESMNDLVQQYESNIEGFKSYLKTINKAFGNNPSQANRIYFSPPLMSRFLGSLFYCSTCYYNFHMIPDLQQIDADFAIANYKIYEGLTKSETNESDQDINVQLPDLKGASNWRSFRDAFEMKLGIIKSKSGFSINYVIDPTPREFTRNNAIRGVTDNINLADEIVFKEKAVHFGKMYKEDNKIVWLHLKAALLRSPSYDHILEYNKTSNGRKAWNTLKQFYEGEDFIQRLQDEAFTILKNTIYKGESNKHKFEYYANKHIKAHKLLVESGYNNGLGMDDATKIQHLKSGIKIEASLEHALTTSRTSGLLRGTFTEFVSFLQAEVNEMQSRKRELRTNININKINTNQNGKIKTHMSEIVDGKRIEGRSYPPEEWRKLNPAQRTAVRRLQRKTKRYNKNNQSNSNRRSNTLSKVDVSSISQAVIAGIKKGTSENGDKDDNVSKITIDTSTNNKRKAQSGSVGDFISKMRK